MNQKYTHVSALLGVSMDVATAVETVDILKEDLTNENQKLHKV